MIISEKYRDRYDRLALNHPWMREMRNETETIGDLIEKRKEEIEERNHLIAKARNSFKSLAESNYDYAKFRKACRKATEIMDVEMGRMGIATDGRALEAAEEPTNAIDGETNGIGDEITLPESDAVKLMRECGGMEHGMGSLRKALGIECVSGWQMRCLKSLADMVERDYVRREEYVALGKSLGLAQAERDELKSRHCPHYHVDKHYCDVHKTRIAELIAERDEWKAKCEHYSTHVDRLMEAICDLARKQPYTFDPEAPYENAELVSKYIDELESKAEGSSKVRACSSDYGADSREKLEADIENYKWFHDEDKLGSIRLLDVVRCWLDRQAAITELELCERCTPYATRKDYEGEIAELQEQVDDYRAEWHRVCQERMNLAHDLGTCMAERDKLQAKISKIKEVANE